MTVKRIDWLALWNDSLADGFRLPPDEAERYWDSRAEEFAAKNRTPWADAILSVMELDSGMNVLEIGAGAGRLTIPLARRVGHVTALDISSAMLRQLKAYATSEGVDNISTVHAPFEEVDTEQMGSYDIVVAAHSLTVQDIKGALDKINALCTGRAYVVMSLRRSMWWHRVLEELTGDSAGGSDRPLYLMGILLDMGYIPQMRNVVIPYSIEFGSVEEAAERCSAIINMPERKEEVMEILPRILTPSKGRYVSRGIVVESVIHWRPDGGGA